MTTKPPTEFLISDEMISKIHKEEFPQEDCTYYWDSIFDRLRKTEIENMRLREALEYVVNRNRARGYPIPKEWDEVVHLARKALEGKS